MSAESNKSNLNAALQADLDELREAGLFRSLRTITSGQGPVITIDGRQFLNFSSNDYLGLSNDPRLKQAAQAAIEKYGVGSGASRLVSGNIEPYDQLERALCQFKQKEAAIVFSSGYVANVGTICSLVGEGDVVIIDKLCHASIIDGCRQSGATLRIYPHKDMRKLESLLESTSRSMWEPLPCGDRGPLPHGSGSHIHSKRQRRVLIITETVYSMDGDVAPLPEIVDLKEKYGAWLMIDEAHGTGVFGENGRGAAEHFSIEDRVEVTLGTLSKAIGCMGGYVAGSRTLIDYLRNKARGIIYSTALPPSVCAAAAAAVAIVMSEDGRKRRKILWLNVNQIGKLLAREGANGRQPGPILPFVIGDEKTAVEVSRQLFERGVYVPAIRYPTVARGKARLRIAVTTAHRGEQIVRLSNELNAVWK
jgi:7-keto-8-aminopelargonate synthetase-like enzyme